MEGLDEIIRGATAEISEEYFLLPIHGAPAQRRERVSSCEAITRCGASLTKAHGS